MNKISIIFAALLVMTAITTSCSGGDKENTEQSKGSGTYQCPMKCEGDKTYNQSGQCPVCNMDLEKVEDHSAHEGKNDHENHDH
jgi:Cu2+-exporting ATPase